MHVPHSIYCEYKNHEKEGFYMSNGDTVKLLRECNAGTKMAVYSMDLISKTLVFFFGCHDDIFEICI